MKELICEKAAKYANLNKNQLQSLLNIAKKASTIGGEILMEYYGNITHIKTKANYSDLVTEADIKAEKAILEYLTLETPNISILAEESGHFDKKNALVWCIDPLDGTTNFANGYPFFATSVGLTYNDMPILGSISVPFLKEIFFGAPMIGAFCFELHFCALA